MERKTNPDITRRMKEAIRTTGLTQAEIARRMGISRGLLHAIIRNGSTSLEVMAKFCEVTNFSMDYIVRGVFPPADLEWARAFRRYISGEREALAELVLRTQAPKPDSN